MLSLGMPRCSSHLSGGQIVDTYISLLGRCATLHVYYDYDKMYATPSTGYLRTDEFPNSLLFLPYSVHRLEAQSSSSLDVFKRDGTLETHLMERSTLSEQIFGRIILLPRQHCTRNTDDQLTSTCPSAMTRILSYERIVFNLWAIHNNVLSLNSLRIVS